jgi:hypothetical protein
MPRLTEKQVLQLASTQDIWKVFVRESEQGWGSDFGRAYEIDAENPNV